MGTRNITIFILVFVGSCLSGQHPVFDAQDLGEGYKSSTWFDQYHAGNFPWIFHEEHGWMYVAWIGQDEVWMWDPTVGDWLWTNPQAYPGLYNRLSGWVDYRGKADKHRRFWDFSTEEMLIDVENPDDVTYFPVPGPLETYTWRYWVNDGLPIRASDPEMELEMTFDPMRVVFAGNSLQRTTDMDAGITGNVLIEGSFYNVTGSLNMDAREHMEKNALGIYQTQADVELFMRLVIAGETFDTTGNVSVSDLGEVFVGFPWKGDLYELPIGTVFFQSSLQAWVEGYVTFSWVGYPEYDEYDPIAMWVDAPMNLRLEITARYPTYQVEGRDYQRVVEILFQMDEPDPSTGAIVTSYGRHWYAPGIGLIKSESSDPLVQDGLLIELIHTNLF